MVYIFTLFKKKNIQVSKLKNEFLPKYPGPALEVREHLDKSVVLETTAVDRWGSNWALWPPNKAAFDENNVLSTVKYGGWNILLQRSVNYWCKCHSVSQYVKLEGCWLQNGTRISNVTQNSPFASNACWRFWHRPHSPLGLLNSQTSEETPIVIIYMVFWPCKDVNIHCSSFSPSF